MEPDPVTVFPVTSMVSTEVSSLVFLIVIFPLSTSTFSLKFSTMFVLTAIPVAWWAGVVLVKYGLPVSCEVKLKAVVDEIPA